MAEIQSTRSALNGEVFIVEIAEGKWIIELVDDGKKLRLMRAEKGNDEEFYYTEEHIRQDGTHEANEVFNSVMAWPDLKSQIDSAIENCVIRERAGRRSSKSGEEQQP